jgi:hypothetical protein
MDDRMRKLLTGLFVLNFLDAILTLVWIQVGFATEANPIMDAVMKIHPGLFLLAKVALVSACLGILWAHRSRALARFCSVFGFSVYSMVIVYHVVGGIATLTGG